jgi:hypothetical protein
VTDTIEVSLPGGHVRKIGGNQAFGELLALATDEAAKAGKQLASQEHKDSSTLHNAANDSSPCSEHYRRKTCNRSG